MPKLISQASFYHRIMTYYPEAGPNGPLRSGSIIFSPGQLLDTSAGVGYVVTKSKSSVLYLQLGSYISCLFTVCMSKKNKKKKKKMIN